MNPLLESFEIFKKVNLTPFHTKYFAYELTKRCSSDSVEQLAGASINAQVDLNPHQVETALFALRSSLSKSAFFADEVCLRKTVEVGLVLSQKWAERKRKILVIALANLLKQWYQVLSENFFLPYTILESKFFNVLPLQYSLFELCGLFCSIDKYVLGDLISFREQIIKKQAQKILKRHFLQYGGI